MYFFQLTVAIFILYYSTNYIMGNCFKLSKQDKKIYNTNYMNHTKDTNQIIRKIKVTKEIELVSKIKKLQLSPKKSPKNDITKSYIILNK